MRLFRKRNAEGKPPENVLLRKPASLVTIDVEEKRSFGFVFSDGSVDRHGDTVDPGGWNTDNFTKGGGPLLWAHQYDTPPLGKVTGLSSGAALRGAVEFTPKGMSEFNDMIYDMVKGGFLSATSVGFSPKEYDYNDARGGFDFKSQELLEVSVVPVPANANALIEARSAGIDLTELEKWVNKGLYWLEGEGSLLVPRSALEMAADALGVEMSIWNAPSEVMMEAMSVTSGTGDLPASTPEEAISDEKAIDEMVDHVVDGLIEIETLKTSLAEANAKVAELEMIDEVEVEGGLTIEFDAVPETVADISDEELRGIVSQSLEDVFAPVRAGLTKVTGRIFD